jgi:hypothetical protein
VLAAGFVVGTGRGFADGLLASGFGGDVAVFDFGGVLFVRDSMRAASFSCSSKRAA